jgi:ubiquinone/menaquinone biosynthesis C-methylase UbiE
MSDKSNDARFWNRLARKYAAGPIGDMAGYERTIERVRAHLKSTDQVLEFGCGSDMTALKLAPAVGRYLATDISSEMIDIGREKAQAENVANIEFQVASLEQAPWPDASFDAILGFNILHLVKDRVDTLRAVHRLLKPGGMFLSKTPCMSEMNPIFRLAVPLMRLVRMAPHVGFFTAKELESEITAAGFEILAHERHASGGKDARPFLVARKA